MISEEKIVQQQISELQHQKFYRQSRTVGTSFLYVLKDQISDVEEKKRFRRQTEPQHCTNVSVQRKMHN